MLKLKKNYKKKLKRSIFVCICFFYKCYKPKLIAFDVVKSAFCYIAPKFY